MSRNEATQQIKNISKDKQYTILKNYFQISPTFIENIYKESDGKKTIIFQKEDGRNDEKRSQVIGDLGILEFKSIKDELVTLMKITNDFKDPVGAYLLSEAGGKEQDPHTDYELLNNFPSYYKYSYIAFVAIMDKTNMVAYNDDGTKFIISLDIGDVLIARQDFIHAGPSYDDENARLHFYFDQMVTCSREDDKTYYTAFDNIAASSEGSYYFASRSTNAFNTHAILRKRKERNKRSAANARRGWNL